MLNKILVPLDGSGLAERALTYATALATASGAQLVLLGSRQTWTPFRASASVWSSSSQLAVAHTTSHYNQRGFALRQRLFNPVRRVANTNVRVDRHSIQAHCWPPSTRRFRRLLSPVLARQLTRPEERLTAVNACRSSLRRTPIASVLFGGPMLRTFPHT